MHIYRTLKKHHHYSKLLNLHAKVMEKTDQKKENVHTVLPIKSIFHSSEQIEQVNFLQKPS